MLEARPCCGVPEQHASFAARVSTDASMAPFRITDLPEDLLSAIATILGHSAPVVAFSSHGLGEDVRVALREGVDLAERQRFPGALTVREAEATLRVRLRLTYESRQKVMTDWGEEETAANAEEILASRISAGREIRTICMLSSYYDEYEDYLDLIPQLLQFGAIPDVADRIDDENLHPNHRASLRLVDDKNGPTALHQIVNSGLPRSPEITALLVSAGADVDKKYDSTTGMSGRAPLAWALSETDDKELSEIALTDLLYNYQCAMMLLEARCDVRTANEDYMSNRTSMSSLDLATLQQLQLFNETVARHADDEPGLPRMLNRTRKWILDSPDIAVDREQEDLDVLGELRELHSQILEAVRAQLA